MLSCIQECAPPGPQVGSISFDFVTKSDGMALVRQGHRQPHWSNCSDASLAIQDWIDQLGIANRISRHAFDWQTKGSAGYGQGLNSAWQPDVSGLAIQTQMAERPRHQCQSLQLTLTLMSKPLPHHCQQDLFRPRRVFHTLASQDQPRHTHQRCRGCQNPPQHYWSLAVGREGQVQCAGRLNC